MLTQRRIAERWCGRTAAGYASALDVLVYGGLKNTLTHVV
jgi:hypothetical protein